MDLSAYGFRSKSNLPSSSESSTEDEETLEPSPPKRQCTTSQPKQRSKFRSVPDVRRYNKKWEQQFPWPEYDEHTQGAFCRECTNMESLFSELEVDGLQNLSLTGRRQLRR